MNKKGDVAYYVTWFVYFTILAVSVFFITRIGSSALESDIQTHGLEYTLLVNRLFYSPNSITYVDEVTKRAYPGIIDANKFTEKNIKSNIWRCKEIWIKSHIGR